jgi:hypothetical protein
MATGWKMDWMEIGMEMAVPIFSNGGSSGKPEISALPRVVYLAEIVGPIS